MLRERHRPRGDRGSTELAIATPLMLLLVLLVVQVALWLHGDHVAASIAQRAAATARTAEGSKADAQARAEALADDLGGSLLNERSITVERGTTTARVEVTAEVPSLIPGLSWPVRRELSVPVERFVPPVNQPDQAGRPETAPEERTDQGGSP